MKQQLIENINAVLGALNSITVSGKANLANLVGSINILENICSTIANMEIPEQEQEKPQMHKG